MILVLGLLLILPLVNLGAEEDIVIGNITPSPIKQGRLLVKDNYGNVKYYLERNVLYPGRWDIYHTDSGSRAGVLERNPLRLYQSDIAVKAPTGARIIINPSTSGVKTRFRRFTK